MHGQHPVGAPDLTDPVDQWDIYVGLTAPITSGRCRCDVVCVCDGGELCEHEHWSIDSFTHDRYCVDCCTTLNDDQETP